MIEWYTYENMSTEIKAVIFDCFGVLTSDGWLPFCKKHFGHDTDLMEQARSINARVDGGVYSYTKMLEDVALLAGIEFEQARKEIESNIADTVLFDFVRDSIKPNYKVGMLSNAGDNWLAELFQPWHVQLFDAIALSYEMGVTKPNSLAYETIATRLDMLPDECIFIDDQPRYVTAAKEIGMKGIVFQNTEQFIREFEEMTK